MYRKPLGSSATRVPWRTVTVTGPSVPGGISTWSRLEPITAVRGERVSPKRTSMAVWVSKPEPTIVAKGPPPVWPSGGWTCSIAKGSLGWAGATLSADSEQPLGHTAAMRTRITALLIGLCSCGGGESAADFDGDYELVEQVSGSCAGPLEPLPIEPTDQFFRLSAEPRDGGTIVAYYSCVSPGECVDTYDLFRSFGRTDGAWVTTVATALGMDGETGCQLRFRQRELSAAGDGLLIVDTVHEELDPELPAAECVQSVARERGDTMPCVSVSELLAEPR